MGKREIRAKSTRTGAAVDEAHHNPHRIGYFSAAQRDERVSRLHEINSGDVIVLPYFQYILDLLSIASDLADKTPSSIHPTRLPTYNELLHEYLVLLSTLRRMNVYIRKVTIIEKIPLWEIADSDVHNDSATAYDSLKAIEQRFSIKLLRD